MARLKRSAPAVPTGTGEQTQICPETAATLPERRRVKIQSLPTFQRAKINVHRSPKPVPNCQSLFLLALDIPERIADILKIEVHPTLLKACPFAVPFPEEVAVRALTCFVAVRAGERFVMPRLGMG